MDLSASLDKFNLANQAEAEAEVEQGDDSGDEVEELEEAKFDASQDKNRKGPTTTRKWMMFALIRAWESVSLDAVTGKDQSAMKYWQRIEDKCHQILPFPSGWSLKSIQGCWDVIKKICGGSVGAWSKCGMHLQVVSRLMIMIALPMNISSKQRVSKPGRSCFTIVGACSRIVRSGG